MDMLSVIRIHPPDWDMALFGAFPLVCGLYMLFAPISFANLLHLLNRNSPGELIPFTDPRKVAGCRQLRMQLQLTGLLIAGFGLFFVLGALGTFGAL